MVATTLCKVTLKTIEKDASALSATELVREEGSAKSDLEIATEKFVTIFFSEVDAAVAAEKRQTERDAHNDSAVSEATAIAISRQHTTRKRRCLPVVRISTTHLSLPLVSIKKKKRPHIALVDSFIFMQTKFFF